jgi:hypothetical protein
MQITSRAILHQGPGSSQRLYYLALIAVALFLIAVLDRATGDVPFQHLYYLPIILAATEFGFPGGLMVSLSSVLLYHLANPRLLLIHEFRQADIVQIILFFTVGLVAAKLADDAKRLRLLSITDDLTGLHNLRSFESHLATLVNQAKKDGSTLSLLVLDVDRLKSLNDSYGHLAGADAVRTVGHLIAHHTQRAQWRAVMGEMNSSSLFLIVEWNKLWRSRNGYAFQFRTSNRFSRLAPSRQVHYRSVLARPVASLRKTWIR